MSTLWRLASSSQSCLNPKEVSGSRGTSACYHRGALALFTRFQHSSQRLFIPISLAFRETNVNIEPPAPSRRCSRQHIEPSDGYICQSSPAAPAWEEGEVQCDQRGFPSPPKDDTKVNHRCKVFVNKFKKFTFISTKKHVVNPVSLHLNLQLMGKVTCILCRFKADNKTLALQADIN